MPHLLVTLLVSLAALAGAREYIVDAAWTGPDGDGSPETPFSRVQSAADRVVPGDIVTVRPGVYFEVVRLQRFGTAAQPILFRGVSRGDERAVITGADRAIRQGEVPWQPVDGTPGLFVIPYAKPPPSRILYSGTDLFPYNSLDGLKTFAATPGIPGPKHGFYADDQAGRLYVRLRPDGKYGLPDPNRHVMAVSPAPLNLFGPQYALNDSRESLAINFGLYGQAGQELHVVLDNFTFETPGRTAIRVSGNHVTIRNCRFTGCWSGGVAGRHFDPQKGYAQASNHITIEFCEWHAFPVWDDVQELITEQRDADGTYPASRRFQWWVHKSPGRGVRLANYETGICSLVGENWTVRNCHIHDCFEAFAAGGWSAGMRFEENLFERCVDNAIQSESHARDMHITRNRFVDVFQAISWQPLSGLPWPGPVLVYQNLFYWTPANQAVWSGLSTASFKIGAPFQQWQDPAVTTLQEVPREQLRIPGAGLLFFNNTIITPDSAVFAELNGTKQKLEPVVLANNLIIAARPRLMRSRLADGGAFHYHYSHNRCHWTDPEPGDQPPLLMAGAGASPEDILPQWRQYDPVPRDMTPAEPVPGAPRQFRWTGAWQEPGDSFAVKVGPQPVP